MASEVLLSDGVLWYCINLESLSAPDDEIVSFAQVEPGMHGWALMGDHIYALDGDYMEPLSEESFCEEDFDQTYVCLELYQRDTLRGATWKIASPSMKFPARGSLVWPLDKNNIIVMAEYCNLTYYPLDDESEECDEGRYAQIFNLESKTWALTNCHFLRFALMSDCVPCPALIADKKGRPEQLLYYSYKRGRLLFCDNDSYRFEVHPNLILSLDDDPKSSIAKGLLDVRTLFLLINAMEMVTPVVRESTLYWFTSDFRLSGYDFIQKRWFQSLPLREIPSELFNMRPPILVDLYDGRFVMIHHHLMFGKMGMLFLKVSKGQDSLNVCEGSSHTFSPESCSSPWHGMAIVRESRCFASPEKSSKGKKSEEQADMDSLKAEVSKLQRKQQQLLGKDLTGLGVNELRLLECQVNEGLLAIRDRKDELLIEQQEHLRRSLDELRGLIPIGASGKRKEPETDFISSNSEKNQFGSK